ncbi:hypothetical protein [Sinobacterium norvegicum]|uniref:hypothetical protein n=1 Tax=Sinobacterium norvegicum TaxID=1641715 RepID=UPI001F301787|nr:hypothetical protein [Sinobacterium norvegicum]
MGKFCLITLCLSLASASHYVAAIEQRLESEIELATDNDSNARMVSDEDKVIKLQGYSLSPRINYSANTERAKFGVMADVEFERFDNDDFNANNVDISLDLLYRLSDKSSVSTSMSFDRSPTRIEEVSDSGSIRSGDVETYNWVGSMQHLLTQKQMLSVSVSSASVKYSNEYYTSRYTAELSAMWRYQWSEKFSFALIPSYSYVDFDTQAYNPSQLIGWANYIYASTGFGNVIDSSQTASLPLQISYQYSEKLAFSAYAGLSRQQLSYLDKKCIESIFYQPYSCNVTAPEKKVSVDEYENESSVFNFSSTYQLSERSEFIVNATRQYQPSSEGELRQVDSIDIKYKGKLAQRHDLTMAANWGESNDPSKELVKDDYQYWIGSISYYYRFSKDWKTSVTYTYRGNEKYNLGRSSRASGQLWGLGLVYTPSEFLL